MPRSSLTSRPSPHRLSVLTDRADRMRRAPTSSEARLFEALRGERLGVTFRRQVLLLGRLIADFFAPDLRLVVEVDGLSHSRRDAADARRDRALARAGYTVIHLDAELVMREVEAAVARVAAEIERLRRAAQPRGS
jgi:very-short-patch-repair endonuclease